MRRFIFLVVISLLLLSASAFAVKVATVERPADLPSFAGYVQDECILVLKDNVGRLNPSLNARGNISVGEPGLDAISARFAVSGMRKQFRTKENAVSATSRKLSRFYKARFNAGDLPAVLEAYRQHPLIEDAYAIPIHITYANPNDGFYGDQWHLTQPSDHDIDASEAWDIETGDQNIIVAILDTGIRYFHKDLGGSNASYNNPTAVDGNMWVNWTEKNGTAGVDDDGNGYIDDWVGWDFVDGATQCWTGEDCNDQDNDPRDFNGHGTHCAGNVSAINNNGYATCAPSGGWGNGTLQPTGNGVKTMACRVGWSGTYIIYEVGYVRMDYIAEAFEYAADNGAKIASCSWGSSYTADLEAAINYFLAQGGIIFKAAGNDGSQSADYMCGRTDIISVAATDNNDCKADFSTYGTWVDISAPGTGIMSSYHSHDDPASDYVATMDGTSMASPLAASVAALIWSQNLSWTASQVEQRLYETADDIYGLSCNSSYAGKLGAGRINAFNAVNQGTPPPVADFDGSPRSGCAALMVDFTDLSTGEITDWYWEFGDGGTSPLQHPSYTYNNAGNYTVTLTVTGPGGSDSEVKTDFISVGDVPVADFTADQTTGCAPLTVNFTDLSTGNPTLWDWNFGDGGTSNDQSPTYTYQNHGAYTVALTVTNACGSDVESKLDYVQVDSCGAQMVFALSDMPVAGTATGNYTNTHGSDDSYEVITEVISTGHPVKIWSYLEHRWNFDVPVGGMVMFYVEAYRPGNSDNDDFTFEYSIDNDNFAPLLTVASAIEATYSAELLPGTSGPVYIRVVDTDRRKGNTSLDPIYIDYMFIESGGEPPPPDTIYVNSIDVTRVGGKGNRWQGQADVTIFGVSGAPIEGALVEGHFTGPSGDYVSGTTGAGGDVTLLSSRVKGPTGYWCFYVDNVSKSGDIYDPTLDVEDFDCESGMAKVMVNRPTHFELLQNHPNPFNPKTDISFTLPEAAQVTLHIYNIMGQRVATLVDDYLEPGFYSFDWDASNVASGIYFYRINAGLTVDTRKMLLLK